MTNLSIKSLLTPVALLALLASASQSFALTPQARMTAPIDNANRMTLADSRSPLANPANDAGAVSPSMQLHGISLIFSRTPAQQASLTALIAAQQNAASPQYHQWLTPDQFAAQFGVADSDIAATEAWLQQQGFSIDSVSRSRNRIFFSGTAAQVASAFGAPIHNFKTATGIQYAPANDLTLPAVLGANVQAIGNLSSFRPQSRLRMRTAAQPSPANASSVLQPQFTSSQTGSHFVTPGDLAVIYDIKPAYNAGYTGVNQSIAIVGQTFILQQDVMNFQAAAGVTAKLPILALVPTSGSSYISSSDEPEADLDVEYSSTIAYGAQVYFIYTGNNTNYNVFDSLQYAVDERVSPIISSSYGACEPALGASNVAILDGILQQAATQGQTVLSAAGDDGSTDCEAEASATLSGTQLAVDYPGSSVYATSMGGSEFPVADTAVGNTTYWAAQGTTDVVASAKSYIPEQVWNDDAIEGATASGGGGASIYEPRPSWQTAGTVIGGVALPAGSFRLVPDISLDASNYSAPLAYCSSATSAWSTGQTSSCTSGFRDSTSQDLTIAGGTSFDGPIFAGMLALINQSLNSTGQGVINPTLYSLAANATTYASAFHDITLAGNQCLAPTVCGTTGAQVTSFAAATGYDEASGLGSIDLYNLLNAWPKPAVAALGETTTTLTAATSTPALSTSDLVTIAVASYNPLTPAISVPTGSVTLLIDGGPANGGTTTTLMLSVTGTASYSFSTAVAGSHFITATYSGNTINGPSTGTIYLNVAATTTTGSFTLTAPNITVAQGSSASSTVSVTPTGGYTGTVDIEIAAPTNLTNSCVTGSNIIVTSAAAATMTLTVYTNSNNCPSNALPLIAGGINRLSFNPATHKVSNLSLPSNIIPNNSRPSTPVSRWPLPAAFAGTLLIVFGLRRRSRLVRASLTLGLLLLLSVAGLGLSGCSSSAVAAPNLATKGSYSLTLTGTDSVNPTLISSSTFTLTIQ
jgi:hypothetical protein